MSCCRNSCLCICKTWRVSERLRRWTRNPLGSARKGSNPLAVDLLLCLLSCSAFAAFSQPSACIAQWQSISRVNWRSRVQSPVQAHFLQHSLCTAPKLNTCKNEGVQKALWRNCSASDSRSHLSFSFSHTQSLAPDTQGEGTECSHLSQRVFHAASIFRLLLKVAVEHMHQCEWSNFWGTSSKQQEKFSFSTQ